jgi:Ca2+-binding EF-hand superfamily protein
MEKVQNHRRRPDVVKILNPQGQELSKEEIDDEYERLRGEVHKIESEISDIEQQSDNKIRVEDLNAALKKLGVTKKRAELEAMIWEVDENLDECVDWEEFKLMYERNMTDKTGLEPFQLFNVVQFMMYDKDNSGEVSIDETMTMLYQRYGKERLESELQKLFGKDLKTQDGDGELSFQEYLKVVEKRLPQETKKKSPKGKKGRGRRRK